MAIFGVSITKQVSYRGGMEQFSNVYHYETDPGQTFDDSQVITDCANNEAELMGTRVQFVEGRSWGPVGNPITSITRTIQTLTRTGAKANQAGMPPEGCFLVSWPAGRSAVTGRIVYLRKWIRPMTLAGGTATMVEETAQIAAGLIPEIEAYANGVQAQGGIGSAAYPLVAASGRGITGPAIVNPWLESHDLKY